MPGACGAELLCGDNGLDHVTFSSGGDSDNNVDSLGGTDDLAMDRGNGHIDFRITVDPDGRVDVNGAELAVCDPADGCRLSLAWSAGTGALVVRVEAADGSLAAAQYCLPEAPSELRVSAAEIRWLSLTPQ